MSPMSDDRLQRNRYVLINDDLRVMDAVIAYRDEEAADWWLLLVDVEDEGYAVAKFESLTAALESASDQQAYLQQTLGGLVGVLLEPVDLVVQHADADYDATVDQLVAADGIAAVVIHGDEVAGVIPRPTTRAGGLFQSSLLQLAGRVADIPDTGLISKRRRKRDDADAEMLDDLKPDAPSPSRGGLFDSGMQEMSGDVGGIADKGLLGKRKKRDADSEGSR